MSAYPLDKVRDNLSRIAELQAKLAARQDRPGFSRNAHAIRAEIARLQAQEPSDGRA